MKSSSEVAGTGWARLARWIERRKLSHADLAKRVEVHQTTVSAILRGAVPSVALALKLQETTKIPVAAWHRPKEPPP